MRIKKFPLLLALMLTIGAAALPLTAYAAGEKDTTPPKLAATLEDGTLHIESSDDNSGVEAVYVDGNRVNSLTNGAASVALKDYAGTGKQVSVYAEDYAGNRSESVKFDNPYYEEPTETETASTTAQAQTSAAATNTAQVQAASTGSTNTSAQSSGGTTSNRSASVVTTSTGGSSSTGSDSSAGSSSSSGSGNDSQASSSAETSGSTSPDSSSEDSEETTSSVPEGAFTPEGTGTILDSATDADGDKQFYTITTEAGNVFYLIVDGKRDDNNVYFLNGVTEDDLMTLAEKSDGSVSVIPAAEVCTCTEKCEAGEVDTNCPVCKNDLTGCTGKEKEVEAEEPEAAEPEKDSSSVGTIIFIIAALLAVGGAGYYVKIVRPKQLAEDDEDFEDDGYGEGFDPDEAFGEPEYLSEDDFDDRDSE